MRHDDRSDEATEIHIFRELRVIHSCSERSREPITHVPEARRMSNRFPALLVPSRNRLSRRDRETRQRARRLALAAVIVACAALAPRASAQGQDPQPQGDAAGERMDPRQVIDLRMAKMTETLKLDSAQQDKVRWIIAAETMQMEALRKNGGGRGGGEGQGGGRGGGRRGARRGSAPPDSTSGGEGRGSSAGPPKEMLAIRDSTNKQIEGLLNAEQLTTYRQLFEHQQ
jgi:hypothetical protein